MSCICVVCELEQGPPRRSDGATSHGGFLGRTRARSGDKPCTHLPRGLSIQTPKYKNKNKELFIVGRDQFSGNLGSLESGEMCGWIETCRDVCAARRITRRGGHLPRWLSRALSDKCRASMIFCMMFADLHGKVFRILHDAVNYHT